jgi:hypothetical protein
MITAQTKKPGGPAGARAAPKSEGLVSDYPLSAVLLVFGVGLGVGVALGSMLMGPATPDPSFVQRTERAAEKLGRQVLGAIAGVLPESLSKHMAT